MDKRLEQKLVNNGWDIEEIKLQLGEPLADTIYDCDIDYCYYHPAAFEKGRFNVAGDMECWYNDKWCSEDELPEV